MAEVVKRHGRSYCPADELNTGTNKNRTQVILIDNIEGPSSDENDDRE